MTVPTTLTIPDNLILVGLTGSHAYGLQHDGYTLPDGTTVRPSDIDTRGVFVMPTVDVLGLGGHAKLYEDKTEDTVYDEIQRFLVLCLKCNPERLEMLATVRQYNYQWTNVDISDYLVRRPEERPGGPFGKRGVLNAWGEEIVKMQDLFLSKRIVNTYGGYANGQVKLIERLQRNNTPWFKPGMHLIRLLITGIGILETGKVDCDVSRFRPDLMSIRKGERTLEEVVSWHQELEAKFQAAAEVSSLPETNAEGAEAANELLIRIRRAYLSPA